VRTLHELPRFRDRWAYLYLVRDELWKRVTALPPLGFVAQIWSAPAPQGFLYRQYGNSRRQQIDFEGIRLTSLQTNKKRRRPPPNAE
jgi:hypothetical protein